MRCSEPPTVSCRPVRVNQTPYPFLLTDTSLDETTNYLDFAVEGIVLQDHLGVLSVRYQGYRLFICVEDVVGLLSARTSDECFCPLLGFVLLFFVEALAWELNMKLLDMKQR